MSISNYVSASFGLLALCAPSPGTAGDPEALVIYAHPPVISAEHLASDLRMTGRTRCDLGFVPGSAKLDLASYAQVQELATVLRDDPELRITLTIRGDRASDQKMARARAVVLVATLRDLDVTPRRVLAAPATNPVAVAFNDIARTALSTD